MKSFVKSAASDVLCIFMMVAAVCLCVSGFGCHITSEGVEIIGGDYSTPKFTELSVVATDCVKLVFTDKVNLKELTVCRVTDENSEESGTEEKILKVEEVMPIAETEPDAIQQGASVSETVRQTAAETESVEADSSEQVVTVPDDENPAESVNAGNSPAEYLVFFEKPLEPSVEYILYAVAEDERNNTLSFSVGFYGLNDNLAELLLSEIRTDMTKTKVEFVELFALKSGNTGGMVLECCNGSKKLEYVMPAVDVKAGDYIVVHLRSIEDSCTDELESYDKCKATDCSDTAVDLWVEGNTKQVSKNGCVVLRERTGSAPCDIICFLESSKTAWPSDIIEESVKEAFECGLWKDGDTFETAFCSDKATTARTITRTGLSELLNLAGAGKLEFPVPVSAENWIIAGGVKATSGTANSETPYTE